jgi:hypothetical protein
MTLWKQILRTNFTRLEAILDYLEIQETDKIKFLNPSRFIVNLPKRIADKIVKGDIISNIIIIFF